MNVAIRVGDTTIITSRAAVGPDGTIQAVPLPGGAPQAVALKDVTAINPPGGAVDRIRVR